MSKVVNLDEFVDVLNRIYQLHVEGKLEGTLIAVKRKDGGIEYGWSTKVSNLEWIGILESLKLELLAGSD